MNRVDEVLIHKAAIIERCVQRARELHAQDPAGFAADLTRQLPITVAVITTHLDEFLAYGMRVHPARGIKATVGPHLAAHGQSLLASVTKADTP